MSPEATFVITAILGVMIYFIPTWVAYTRGAVKSSGIAVLNVFLGWTFIGWVVALVWAVSGDVRQD